MFVNRAACTAGDKENSLVAMEKFCDPAGMAVFLFSLFRPPVRRTMREKSLPCEKKSYRPFPKAKPFPIPCLRAAHCRPPRRQSFSSIYLLRMYI